jgi:hypothetical protein
MGLFLQALLKLSRLGIVNDRAPIVRMVSRIAALRSDHAKYSCWGYSFPWQGRALLVPRWAPNLVCTTFVADALIDAYEAMGDSRCLEMAISAAGYLLDDLYWEEGDVSSFCYPSPTSRVQVHNANFLGAALLSRVHAHTGEGRLAEVALRIARFSASRQHDDGSWDYGADSTQQWVDNFHTGFNLCALKTIAATLGTGEFDGALSAGFKYYRDSFFLPNHAPKYYDRRTYPIDAHAVAQSIITLLAFKSDHSSAETAAFGVFDWGMKHLWNRSGYFYYWQYRILRNKISYMRWTQAWMLLALTTLLEDLARSPAGMGIASSSSLQASEVVR